MTNDTSQLQNQKNHTKFSSTNPTHLAIEKKKNGKPSLSHTSHIIIITHCLQCFTQVAAHNPFVEFDEKQKVHTLSTLLKEIAHSWNKWPTISALNPCHKNTIFPLSYRRSEMMFCLLIFLLKIHALFAIFLWLATILFQKFIGTKVYVLLLKLKVCTTFGTMKPFSSYN